MYTLGRYLHSIQKRNLCRGYAMFHQPSHKYTTKIKTALLGSQKDPNKRSWFQLVQRSLTNIYQKNLIILLFFPTLYHQISAVQARHILTNTHRSQLFISSIVHFKELLAKITNILSLKRSTIHHLSITHKYYSEMKVFTVTVTVTICSYQDPFEISQSSN